MPTLAEFVRRVSRPTRSIAGHTGEAALAARTSGRGLRRRSAGRVASSEIAAWRMTIPARIPVRGHAGATGRCSARAVVWGLFDFNPAKQGVENPTTTAHGEAPVRVLGRARRRRRPRSGRAYGPMVIFAAATGMRPGEWVALEQRDIDRDVRVVYVRRSFSKGGLKVPKTEASMRAVPLQARALAALEQLPRRGRRSCSSRPSAAATSTCTTSATATGNPLSSRPGSSRSGASTISGTPSRPSPFVPASPPSTSRATWAPA